MNTFKFASYEPGQIVRGLDLSAYRVTSKVAGPEGAVVKLANLQGEPVSPPANFTPVGSRMARFASAMFFHLAYNKDFDLYVRAYCEQAGLPIPVGPDGKPFKWSDWLQSTISPKLIVPGHMGEDAQTVKDEAIHEMLFTELGHRNILGKFKAAIKNFPKDVQKLPEANQLTVYLVKNFRGRVEEMNRKIKELYSAGTVSIEQENGEDDESYNLLDTEEFATAPDAEEVEAQHEIKKFRDGFYEWLKKHQSEKSAKWFITLFDIYWQWINESSETEDAEGRPSYMPARRHLEPEWAERTGLSNASLYDYIGRMAKLLEQYIKESRQTLGDKNVFVKLMDGINAQREALKKKQKKPAPKQKAMPAHASLDDLKIAEAEGLGQCSCEHPDCPSHQGTRCPKPAVHMVKIMDYEPDALCAECMEFVRDFLEREHGDPTLGRAELTPDMFQVVAYEDQGMKPLTGGSPAMNLDELHQRTAKDAYCDACDRPEASCVCDKKDCDLTRKRGSTGANCFFIEWKPGEWYYVLENRGYEEDYEEPWDWRENAAAYGPFKTFDAAHEHLRANHANPGGFSREEYREGRKSDPVMDKLIADAPKNTQPRRGWGRWGSVKTAKLVRGDQLTPEMEQQVKDAFIYRWTVDNPKRTTVYRCDKCDITQPYVNEGSAEGHTHPTIPLQTDSEWIREHAFYFTNDGRLMARRSAEPIYLAKEARKIAKSVDEKREELREELKMGGPGLNGYAYNAAVYCPECGEAIIDELLDSNALPIHSDDDPASTMTGWMWDTDTVPQPIFFGESDGPEHCDNCGEYLYGPETPEEETCEMCGVSGGRHTENCPEYQRMQDEKADAAFTPEDKWYLEQMKIKSSENDTFECCGGFKPRHKEGCPVYEKNFTETMDRLRSLPKKEAEFAGDDLTEAAGNILEARGDNMLTSADWKLLAEAIMVSGVGRVYEERGIQHGPKSIVHSARALLEAAKNLIEAKKNQMVTSEEWEALAQAYKDATGQFINWRTPDEQDDELEKEASSKTAIDQHSYEVAMKIFTYLLAGVVGHDIGEWLGQIRDKWLDKPFPGQVPRSVQRAFEKIVYDRLPSDQAEELNNLVKEKTEGYVKDWYSDPKNRDVKEGATKEATEPLQQLRPDITPGDTGRLPHATKEGAIAEKIWECRNCPAWGTDKDSANEHSVNRNHGIRMLKDAAGPVTPQQMQTQNVQKSQGVEPEVQQPQQQPMQPNNPMVAITPESGFGEDQPMRKTIPPELPNQNFHMSSDKTAGYMTDQQMMQEFFRPRTEREVEQDYRDQQPVSEATKMRRGLGEPAVKRHEGSGEKTAMLKTETNTPEMEQEVEHLIATHPLTEVHKGCTPVFEHGQWWVTCGPCGAIFSVVDAEGGMSINGLDLEELETGDESCMEEYRDEHTASTKGTVFSDKKRFFESVKHKRHAN